MKKSFVYIKSYSLLTMINVFLYLRNVWIQWYLFDPFSLKEYYMNSLTFAVRFKKEFPPFIFDNVIPDRVKLSPKLSILSISDSISSILSKK